MALTRPKYSQIYDTDYKNSVRVATTGSDVGDLTSTANMPNTLDGVNLVINDRILVKDQNNTAQNGIYYVSVLGTGSNGTWIRAKDADALGPNKVTAGLTVIATEGTANGDKEFRLLTPDPITVGVTGLVFQAVTGYPGGANTYVQFNDSGTLSGSSAVTFDKTSGNLTVANLIVTGITSFKNETVLGNITTLGNITALNFVGNGSQLTGTGPSYTASSTPPVNPAVKDLWYDTGTDILFLYESDNVSSHWVDINTQVNTPFTANNNVNFGNVGVQYAISTSNLAVTSAAQSTSTTTGALVIAGGVGIGSNLNVFGNVTIGGVSTITANLNLINANMTMISTALTTDRSVLILSGNPDGSVQAPNNTGVMLHIVGQPTVPARMYIDGQGANNYPAYIGRHYNGTVASPTAVTAGETIVRYGGTPYTSTGWPSISTVRIDMVADEGQTGTNQGSRIDFYYTPLANTTSTITRGMVIGSNGVSISSNIQSNSSTIGALTVGGGIGVGANVTVGGNLNVSGNANIGGTTTSNLVSVSAMIISGSVGAGGNIVSNNSVVLGNTQGGYGASMRFNPSLNSIDFFFG